MRLESKVWSIPSLAREILFAGAKDRPPTRGEWHGGMCPPTFLEDNKSVNSYFSLAGLKAHGTEASIQWWPGL